MDDHRSGAPDSPPPTASSTQFDTDAPLLGRHPGPSSERSSSGCSVSIRSDPNDDIHPARHPCPSSARSIGHRIRILLKPTRRRCQLLLVFVLPALICFVGLSLLAIHHRLIPSPPTLPSLNAFESRQQLGSSVKQFSTDLRQWIGAVPSAFPPLLSLASSRYPFLPIHRANSYLGPSSVADSDRSQPPHPILPLLLKARSSWQSIIKSQPTALEQARSDYLTRFHPLKPPPGFDLWYSFARDRNFTLFNQFDTLMLDLEPFRALTPAEINRRTAELIKIPGVTLVKIQAGGQIELKTTTGRMAPGRSIQRMIETIISQSEWKPPQLDLALNEHSQGRILPRQSRPVTGEEFAFLSESTRKLYGEPSFLSPSLIFLLIPCFPKKNREAAQDPERTPSLAGFKPEWGHDGNVWDAYRRACPPGSAARRLVETLRAAESQTGAIAAGGGLAFSGDQKHFSKKSWSRRRALHPPGTAPLPSRNEMTFLAETEAAASFCDQPSTHHLHSAFFSDQRSIEHLYPLFSASKAQGFADILVPSHYHYLPASEFTYEYELKHGQATAPSDPSWTDKQNRLYWHGKLTRGANTPPGHMSSFQKQRLVKLISNDTEVATMLSSQAHRQGEADPSMRSQIDRVLVALNASSSTLVSVSAPATVSDPMLLDIAIACDPAAGECKNYESQGYHIQPPAPLTEAWKSKLVLDIDDVGFSPRFGALMESTSAVVKMSVHQEFWRDWIQPWYHFIPLSSSYAELHNLVTFFVGVPEELANQTLPIKGPASTNHIDVVVDTKDHKQADLEADDGMASFNSDEELRMIGRSGRDWKLRHLRPEDMEVYLFRLLVEWSRILHPESDESSGDAGIR